jgi:hypothetical protein
MPFPVGQAIIFFILGAFFAPWILTMVSGRKTQSAGY